MTKEDQGSPEPTHDLKDDLKDDLLDLLDEETWESLVKVTENESILSLNGGFLGHWDPPSATGGRRTCGPPPGTSWGHPRSCTLPLRRDATICVARDFQAKGGQLRQNRRRMGNAEGKSRANPGQIDEGRRGGGLQGQQRPTAKARTPPRKLPKDSSRRRKPENLRRQ
ncbi:uncharacterized protein LOC143032579 [Oratosquilla oratoria]|uniref:uncharacterized protein LOC143032579 n=1 Tax=Oratosquilla oratoria TaxID=337810 RepID=UPI003F7678D7